MIYLTGDLHGDFERFRSKEMKKLKKGDTLIVCGDFGFVWDGSKKEQSILKKLGKSKYQILFIEGTHCIYGNVWAKTDRTLKLFGNLAGK